MIYNLFWANESILVAHRVVETLFREWKSLVLTVRRMRHITTFLFSWRSKNSKTSFFTSIPLHFTIVFNSFSNSYTNFSILFKDSVSFWEYLCHGRESNPYDLFRSWDFLTTTTFVANMCCFLSNALILFVVWTLS